MSSARERDDIAQDIYRAVGALNSLMKEASEQGIFFRLSCLLFEQQENGSLAPSSFTFQPVSHFSAEVFRVYYPEGEGKKDRSGMN